jgi:hypothetical protein
MGFRIILEVHHVLFLCPSNNDVAFKITVVLVMSNSNNTLSVHQVSIKK